MKNMPLSLTKEEMKSLEMNGKNGKLTDREKIILALAMKTDGYVGADIESLCREAAILALRKNIEAKEVTLTHFEEALKKVRPSVSKEIEKEYESLKEVFSAAKARQIDR